MTPAHRRCHRRRSLVALGAVVVALSLAPPRAESQQTLPVEIREAIADEDGDRIPDRLGDSLTLVGVLTTDPYPAVGRTQRRLYLQDSSGAIRLLTLDLGLMDGLVRGDSVIVSGTVGHYQAVDILEPNWIRRLGRGRLPEPRLVRVADLLGERYSGQLIRVVGRLVPRREPRLADESGEIRLYTRDAFFADARFSRLWLSSADIEVVGIAEQFDSSAPFDCCYRLFLPDPAGLVEIPPMATAVRFALIALAGLLVGAVAFSAFASVQRRNAERREREIRSSEEKLQNSHDLLSAVLEGRKRLEREILQISAREQRRIGQDLHDGLGQHLTGIAFLSKALAQQLAVESSPKAADAVEIEKLVNETIKQTRNLAKGLHPTALVTGGLGMALEELASATEQLFDVSCVLAADRAAALPDDMAAQLYYVAQEAVTNAVKHGKASNITLVLQAAGDTTTLTVEDDGRGFPADGEEAQGMGLHIMRYRAKMIDGSLDIRPRPGGGTVVLCSFPTPPTKAGESKAYVGESNQQELNSDP